MAEGSDALLDRLDRVIKDEFNAKMLGRVGRGQLTEVKFLKQTLRWHEQEMCFSWSGGTRYVTELAILLGHRHSSFDEDTNSGNEGNWRRCSRCPARSATREPTKLDWMRMLRLARFLVAHSELEWLCQAQDLLEKYAVYGDFDWAGSDSRRSTTGAFEQYGQHPIEFSCSIQHVAAPSSGGRAVCNRTCGSRRAAVIPAVGRGWNGSEAGSAHGQHGEPWHAQLYRFRASTTPGREMVLDSGSRASLAILIEEVWHIQQRERSDDETSRCRETEGLDDFGETGMHQRTRGRSLHGQ